MRFYISDLHFFHEKLNTSFDNRGFENANVMNEYMISQWNSRVRKKDEVVILGDFSFGKAEATNEILKRLNGKKYMIAGNHDTFLLDNKFDDSLVVWVHQYKELHDAGRKVICSHYPIMCYNGQNSLTKANSPRTYMLYGHVHNSYDEVLINRYINTVRSSYREHKDSLPTPIPCNMINCFCVFSDYVPLTLDEWIILDEKRRQKLNEQDDKAVLR